MSLASVSGDTRLWSSAAPGPWRGWSLLAELAAVTNELESDCETQLRRMEELLPC